MTDVRTPPSSDNMRGSLMMVLAMASFAVNDALVKFATAEVSPAQVMAVRGAMAAALLFAIAALRGMLRPAAIALRGPVLVRAVADVAATIAYITALSQLPLANVTAILQALPLAVTLGAILFFGERPGWRRWSAIGVGLVGVLVIIQPGSDGFTAYSLAVLLAVAACTVRDLVTRKVPPATPSVLVSGVTAVAVAVFGLALLPLYGWQPMSGATMTALALAALAVATGYVAIVAATRTGEIGVVAPFRYTVLLFAIILGFVAFGERPSGTDLLGSLIVVASGVYVFSRERRLGRLPAVPAQVR